MKHTFAAARHQPPSISTSPNASFHSSVPQNHLDRVIAVGAMANVLRGPGLINCGIMQIFIIDMTRMVLMRWGCALWCVRCATAAARRNILDEVSYSIRHRKGIWWVRGDGLSMFWIIQTRYDLTRGRRHYNEIWKLYVIITIQSFLLFNEEKIPYKLHIYCSKNCWNLL